MFNDGVIENIQPIVPSNDDAKIKKLLNIWPYAYGLKHGLKCINIFVVLTFLFSLSNIPLELSLITICYVCSRLAQN